MDTRGAYRHCEEITWSQARNFSYGIRLLPPAKRRALAAVYAFARRIDDIGDGTLPAPDKLAALGAARASVAALAAGAAPAQAAVPGQATVPGPAPIPVSRSAAGPGVSEPAAASDPVLVALADAARRFPIPLDAFGELIDGCEADVRGATYLTFDDLLRYCRCVAGSVGRLSLGIFGTPDAIVAAPLADALGVALQLTNILRDIREDYRSGRVYLPAEDIQRFGCTLRPGGQREGGQDVGGLDMGGLGDPADHEKLAKLVGFEVDRARGWYATGLKLMPLLDRRSAASAGAMAGIYFRLLENIAAAPSSVLQRRVSLSTGEKAMVAARSLAGMARPALAGAAR